MQKRTQSTKFLDKFSSLNSQQSEEEIHWSSSESSDYENVKNAPKLQIIKKYCNKRKRKKKALKNISNLNISVLDVSENGKKERRCESSSMLSRKQDNILLPHSPVLSPQSLRLPPIQCIEPTSPILVSKKNMQLSASPVIQQKFSSKTQDVKKRRLFHTDSYNELNKQDLRSTSPILLKNNNVFQVNCNMLDSLGKQHLNEENISNSIKETFKCNTDKSAKENSLIRIHSNEKNLNHSIDSLNFFDNNSISHIESIKKIKSFFDNNFSSDNASQFSISDNTTPKDSQTKSNDDIEITCSVTQIHNNNSTKLKEEIVKNISWDSTSTVYVNEKLKKVKYKKDGLAFRLNALLKKHNASISLWQHERYLAENSNFVIPSEECKVFRIQKVNFQYGCYLLEAMDANDGHFLIVINNVFVNNNFGEHLYFKLYKPYSILDYNTYYKLIINVCKFCFE